ncbi:MAG: glutathione S-transferase family protein [Pseudomonadota bacterium]
MDHSVELHGYKYSVYNRIARLALEEKAIPYTTVEVNPFDPPIPESYLAMQPFGRVPVLCHNGFTLYETSAITRYIDSTFDGLDLTPSSPVAAARMAQVIAIIDHYGYWPMVRQVFVERVCNPTEGLPLSEEVISEGLEASKAVLTALEAIARERLVLDPGEMTLADCHLAPMIDYFTAAQDGADLLARFPALSAWWADASVRPAFVRTDPGLLAN